MWVGVGPGLWVAVRQVGEVFIKVRLTAYVHIDTHQALTELFMGQVICDSTETHVSYEGFIPRKLISPLRTHLPGVQIYP